MTTERNLAALAAQRFGDMVKDENTRHTDFPFPEGQLEAAMLWTGLPRERFTEALGKFSGVKDGLAIGAWGTFYRYVFDIKNREVLSFFWRDAAPVFYRVVLGNEEDALEFPFSTNSNHIGIAVGATALPEEMVLSDIKRSELLVRLDEAGIDVVEYLI